MDGSRPGRLLTAALLAGAGAIGSALLALSCCVAPLALASLGIGSLGAAALAPHARPFFLGLSVLFIAYTTWLNIRNRRRLADAAAACACAVGSARRTARALNVTLFAASVGVVILFASPRLVAFVKTPAPSPPAQVAAGAPGGEMVSVPVKEPGQVVGVGDRRRGHASHGGVEEHQRDVLSRRRQTPALGVAPQRRSS